MYMLFERWVGVIATTLTELIRIECVTDTNTPGVGTQTLAASCVPGLLQWRSEGVRAPAA
jgi:hypothetical protein